MVGPAATTATGVASAHRQAILSESAVMVCAREVPEAAHALVRDLDAQGSFDSAHDMEHVMRVRSNAAQIARGELDSTETAALRLIETIALLHDVYDSKMEGWETRKEKVVQFLDGHVDAANLSAESRDVVLQTIEDISFRKESAQSAAKRETPPPLILGIVQDAVSASETTPPRTGRLLLSCIHTHVSTLT